MEVITYQNIKTTIEELAHKINAGQELLPDYGQTRDFAYPHIEIDKLGLLHFVVVERGQELQRRTTNKLDELLYWIFSGMTFCMACDFELKNRKDSLDCRRVIFQKQEELLEQLSNNWSQKEIVAHQKILDSYPFRDD